MTRVMYDAIRPTLIPDPAPAVVAGYVGGAWPSWHGYIDTNGVSVPSVRTLFPRAVHVSVAVSPDLDAHVLDCERFDATPVQCPAWAVRQRARGSVAYVYMNASTWPSVVAAFDAAHVPQPQYWVADYSSAPIIPPGAAGLQWRCTPGYDVSVVADYLPGIDPAPAGPARPGTPYPTGDVDMIVTRTVVDRLGRPLPGPSQVVCVHAAGLHVHGASSTAVDVALKAGVHPPVPVNQLQHDELVRCLVG